MNKREINEFIERMEELGDTWEPEDVKRVFGDDSLEDALQKRRAQLEMFGGILGTILNH